MRRSADLTDAIDSVQDAGKSHMNPRVIAVQPNPDYMLTLAFANCEIRTFDVKPYLKIGIFQGLQDQQAFNSVRPFLGSIRWENGQDLCPDTLYLDSVPVYALQQVAA